MSELETEIWQLIISSNIEDSVLGIILAYKNFGKSWIQNHLGYYGIDDEIEIHTIMSEYSDHRKALCYKRKCEYEYIIFPDIAVGYNGSQIFSFPRETAIYGANREPELRKIIYELRRST